MKVAPYATYGTRELALNAVGTMGEQTAVLLQNHGVLAVGPALARAYTVAEKVEFVAELYYRALQLGTPNILPDDELARVQEKIRAYRAVPRAPAPQVESATEAAKPKRASRRGVSRRDQAAPTD